MRHQPCETNEHGEPLFRFGNGLGAWLWRGLGHQRSCLHPIRWTDGRPFRPFELVSLDLFGWSVQQATHLTDDQADDLLDVIEAQPVEEVPHG